MVWVGIRGTYALKEWGYERPPTKLFDAVADIVCTDYKKTGRPVSFEKICTEIGKYRQVINKESITLQSQ